MCRSLMVAKRNSSGPGGGLSVRTARWPRSAPLAVSKRASSSVPAGSPPTTIDPGPTGPIVRSRPGSSRSTSRSPTRTRDVSGSRRDQVSCIESMSTAKSSGPVARDRPTPRGSAGQVVGEGVSVTHPQGDVDLEPLEVLGQLLVALGHLVLLEERVDVLGDLGLGQRADAAEHADDAVAREAVVERVPVLADERPGPLALL